MRKKALIQLQADISITKCTSYITLTGESRHKGLFRWLLKSLPSPISMIFEKYISNCIWSSAKNGAHKIILCENQPEICATGYPFSGTQLTSNCPFHTAVSISTQKLEKGLCSVAVSIMHVQHPR